MRFKGVVCLAFVCAVLAYGPTGAADEGEVQWLSRVQTAPRRVSYTGVFVYQHGATMQSSRVTHIVDAQGSRERLEVLDGQPREVLRTDEEVRCLLPHMKTILVDQSGKRDGFPRLIQSSAEDIAELYTLRRQRGERVAGWETDVLEFTPRDAWRYGYRVWVEKGTGLPLKFQTVDERGQMIDQIAFTEVRIGPSVDKTGLKTRWNTQGWRIEVSELLAPNAKSDIASPVPGFKQLREIRRTMAGHADVRQVVFSDGLASVSVFIEPWQDGRPRAEAVSAQGAISMVTRRVGDHWLTVVGEVPPATLKQFSAIKF